MIRDTKLISIENVATELGLNGATIRIWAARRKIASVKLGRRRLIPVGELQRLIDEGTVPALPARPER